MTEAEKAIIDAAEAAKDKDEIEAARIASEAAATAVAAANAGAALANANAAKTEAEAAEAIEENEGEMSWLKNQVETQGQVLNNLASAQAETQSKISTVLSGLENLSALISDKSQPKPEGEVDPTKAARKKEEEEGPPEPKPDQPKKSEPHKRRWL